MIGVGPTPSANVDRFVEAKRAARGRILGRFGGFPVDGFRVGINGLGS